MLPRPPPPALPFFAACGARAVQAWGLRLPSEPAWRLGPASSCGDGALGLLCPQEAQQRIPRRQPGLALVPGASK